MLLTLTWVRLRLVAWLRSSRRSCCYRREQGIAKICGRYRRYPGSSRNHHCPSDPVSNFSHGPSSAVSKRAVSVILHCYICQNMCSRWQARPETPCLQIKAPSWCLARRLDPQQSSAAGMPDVMLTIALTLHAREGERGYKFVHAHSLGQKSPFSAEHAN